MTVSSREKGGFPNVGNSALSQKRTTLRPHSFSCLFWRPFEHCCFCIRTRVLNRLELFGRFGLFLVCSCSGSCYFASCWSSCSLSLAAVFFFCCSMLICLLFRVDIRGLLGFHAWWNAGLAKPRYQNHRRPQNQSKVLQYHSPSLSTILFSIYLCISTFVDGWWWWSGSIRCQIPNLGVISRSLSRCSNILEYPLFPTTMSFTRRTSSIDAGSLLTG